MKYFLKVFSIAFLCFMLAIGAGLFTYFKIHEPNAVADDIKGDEARENNEELTEEELENLPPLQRAIKQSNRINALLIGIEEEGRSDTMVFASFDPDTKSVDLISIPRDTYYWIKGYNDAGNRKLNASYIRNIRKGHDKAANAVKNAVENILGVPIHHYATVSYDGVEKIVDSLGGVEVNVPFHMVYEDTTPGHKPLYINIPKGKQMLDGEEAVKFLRYRKGYSDGDLGRIEAQQQFIKAALKKALSFNLPKVAITAAKEVKTDVSLVDVPIYAAKAIGMKMENVEAHTLPGTTKYMAFEGQTLSYFVYDPKQIKNQVKDIYDVKDTTENNKEN